jgi:hypothetical protein
MLRYSITFFTASARGMANSARVSTMTATQHVLKAGAGRKWPAVVSPNQSEDNSAFDDAMDDWYYPTPLTFNRIYKGAFDERGVHL